MAEDIADIAACIPEVRSFPSKKVLTISAEGYAIIMGGSLLEYIAQGVHSAGMAKDPQEVMREFLNEVPLNTEAVVNYRVSICADSRSVFYTASGTALKRRE